MEKFCENYKKVYPYTKHMYYKTRGSRLYLVSYYVIWGHRKYRFCKSDYTKSGNCVMSEKKCSPPQKIVLIKLLND